MSARENLFGFVEAGAQEEDLPTFAAAIDAFRAEVSAEGLTVVERAFLNFALGLAADVMASCGDEFGAEDEAALASFRHMAAPAPVESAGDEQGEVPHPAPCRYPSSPYCTCTTGGAS